MTTGDNTVVSDIQPAMLANHSPHHTHASPK
jgi:hypothetical protein